MTDTDNWAAIRTAPAVFLPVSLLFSCSALLWAYVLTGSGTGMSVWAMTRLSLPPAQHVAGLVVDWTASYALQMVMMWWTMMLAMMLLPIGLNEFNRFRRSTVLDILVFLCGYSFVWLLFAIAATGLQWGLERAALLHPFMMWSVSPNLSAALLAGAGVYQLTDLKSRTRSACRLSRLSLHSALAFGQNCVLSTGPLMLLFFVGGAMNLVWMTGLTLIVLAERCLEDRKLFDLSLSALLVGTSIWCVYH
ncbi:DUF2182 domain-containing protein [Roseibium sp. SCPC15]|uniref:DUF2182 domain-containing protein n=1 Tax=Roseibium sp. SCP15 TaxID=3141376 RepID=UPI0033383F53